ncbi:hypothetical protein VTK73DRAFT_2150 [Phialemonium thermophilum]|uniref:Polyketide synthase-like phosphopantetheine-binding domain-containing protein n=1 Tax=Phialemonium thermophilum TaxID=223376 RepID=A0ABR3VSG9_9PEZI
MHSVIQRGLSIWPIRWLACRGIGHAAMQVCRNAGAEAVRHGEQRGQSRLRPHRARYPARPHLRLAGRLFATDVARETGGRSVEIILNSLSGKLLHALWDCIAEFGQLVELGNRGLVGHGPSPSSPSYAISGPSQRPPSSLPRRKGDHIGKVVVSMPEDADDLSAAPQAAEIQFDSTARYVITEWLGGVGRLVASWMAERGARSIVFLSCRPRTSCAPADGRERRAPGRRIFQFMMRDAADLDLGKRVAALGMDSLMAIELRRWWKQSFGVEATVRDLGVLPTEGLVRSVVSGSS